MGGTWYRVPCSNPPLPVGSGLLGVLLPTLGAPWFGTDPPTPQTQPNASAFPCRHPPHLTLEELFEVKQLHHAAGNAHAQAEDGKPRHARVGLLWGWKGEGGSAVVAGAR